MQQQGLLRQLTLFLFLFLFLFLCRVDAFADD
jgi:hypothetical protein